MTQGAPSCPARTIIGQVHISTLRDQQPHTLLPLDLSVALRPESQYGDIHETEAVFVLHGEIEEPLRLRVREEVLQQRDVPKHTRTRQAVRDELGLLRRRQPYVGREQMRELRGRGVDGL